MASRTLVIATLLLCWGSHVVPGAEGACNNVTAFATQLDTLLAEYDREVPPASSLQVELSLDVRHASVLEQTSALRLLADLHMTWQDGRVTWNASEWGCEWALAAAERLWLPDVALVNAASTSDSDEPLRARLTSDGTISWAMRLDVSIPIPLKMDDWPSDVQTGVFKFASREHTADEMDLTVKDSQYATVFETGDWEIASLSHTASSLPTTAGAGEVRRVAGWTLALRRRAPAQALAARAVLATALLLLLAAALLPPSSRAPLAAAAACTCAFWLSGAASRASGGHSAARGVVLAGAVCAVCGAGAACAALAARVSRLAAPPPRAVSRAVSAASMLWTFSPPLEGSGESGAWAAAARLLDAALLLVLAFTTFVLLCVYL